MRVAIYIRVSTLDQAREGYSLAAQRAAEFAERIQKLDTALETIRLLSYARLSEEIERLLTQGFATPQERHILDEMFKNYKAHGWNGDMDARLEKVYRLRTDHAE